MNESWIRTSVDSRTPRRVLAMLSGLAWTASMAAAQSPISNPGYPAGLDAPMLARLVDSHLADARAAIERLVAAGGPRTAVNTLRPFDDAQNHLALAEGLASIATDLHPDTAVRAEGMRAADRIRRFRAELRAEPRVVRAFESLDTTTLDAEERLFVARARRDFHRAGADRDEATRSAIRRHFATLERLDALFVRNIASDSTKVLATTEELAGLPPDWIAAHKRDAQGNVILTTSYPDFTTIVSYSSRLPLRRRLALAFTNRGWPANNVVLDSLLRVREATAHLLGYRDWVSYQAETRMARSPDSIRAFIERVRVAAAPARDRLAARYTAILQREDSTFGTPGFGDFARAAELARREQYTLDRRELRKYFPFEQVRAGLLGIFAELFGLEFRRVNVPVWDPSVEAYEAREQGRLIGRFYLDLHPRPGKVPFGATGILRPGITGRQLPEVVLAAQVPGGTPGDPGLMEHTGVTGTTVLFHEFGHVLHFLLGVRPYLSTGAPPDELDFVEVPSTMLEEFVWQPAVLRRITKHVETGQPIPEDLVDRMRKAAAFDRPIQAMSNAAISALSLALHERPASEIDPDSLARWAVATYARLELRPEMHLARSFEHFGIAPYAATYYTFLWSQVIAEDLWSIFNPADALDPVPARRYRDLILRPGSSRPAAEMVREFLGRPFSFASWQRWLEGQ